MGTDIMELKLAQELASVGQDPLLFVFLYLQRYYENLNCGSLLQNL